MKRLALLVLLLLSPTLMAQPKPPVHSKGYKPLPPAVQKKMHADAFARHGYIMRELAKNVTPPAEFDCKDMGWCVDAGDQASCGSCYLYSTIKTASDAAIKAGLGKVGSFRLSTQYGMDCHDFGGCNGGNGTEVIDWMAKNGWLAEADPSQAPGALYPAYEAQSMQCRAPASAKKYTPKSWQFVTGDQGDHPATVLEYKAALMTFGIVNIAIDAGGQFGNYSGGVITSMGSSIDHEVNIRGWSDAKQALLCENQWAGWGGAKSAGDNCCWISYNAVSALQDPFTVLFESPTPPVPPVPPPVPPVPPPVPPVPPVPPTPGTVSINLTDAQVASVNAQSGAVIISESMTLKDLLSILQPNSLQIRGDMTLNEVLAAIARAKAAKPPCPPCESKEPPKPAATILKAPDQTAALAKELEQQGLAIKAILKALLKKEQQP